MGQNKDLSKWIKDITQEVIHGDPSRLKDIGRDIRDAVIKNIGYNQDTPSSASSSVPPHEPKPNNCAPKVSALTETHLEPKRWMGLPALVFSTIGLVIFVLAAAILGILSLVIPDAGTLFGILCAVSMAPVLLFTGLIIWGIRKRRLALRTRRLIALLKEKSVRTLSEIAHITGTTVKIIKKDVVQATKKHILSGIRLDDQETSLIYGTEAYQAYRENEQRRKEYETAEKERLQRMNNPDLADLEKFNSMKLEVLRNIRSCYDTFPDSSMSEKLSKLEGIIEKIFIYVETHPKKLPLTRKFTSYYLPSTLKLLDKYQQFDRIDSEIAQTAKDDIEETLDTVYNAFVTLLEQLTEEDILDVSTDIKVLETLLAQEGLTGQKFDIGKGARIS